MHAYPKVPTHTTSSTSITLKSAIWSELYKILITKSSTNHLMRVQSKNLAPAVLSLSFLIDSWFGITNPVPMQSRGHSASLPFWGINGLALNIKQHKQPTGFKIKHNSKINYMDNMIIQDSQALLPKASGCFVLDSSGQLISTVINTQVANSAPVFAREVNFQWLGALLLLLSLNFSYYL